MQYLNLCACEISPPCESCWRPRMTSLFFFLLLLSEVEFSASSLTGWNQSAGWLLSEMVLGVFFPVLPAIHRTQFFVITGLRPVAFLAASGDGAIQLPVTVHISCHVASSLFKAAVACWILLPLGIFLTPSYATSWKKKKQLCFLKNSCNYIRPTR